MNLFDLDEFITPKLLNILYAIGFAIIIPLTAWFTLNNIMEDNFIWASIYLVGGILAILILRIWVEFLIVIFRIEENTRK